MRSRMVHHRTSQAVADWLSSAAVLRLEKRDGRLLRHDVFGRGWCGDYRVDADEAHEAEGCAAESADPAEFLAALSPGVMPHLAAKSQMP